MADDPEDEREAPFGYDSKGRRRHAGQFKPGHPGNIGRRARTKKNEDKNARAKAVRKALLSEIKSIDDKATFNVLGAIDKGCVRTSIWWIEHRAKTEGPRLSQRLKGEIKHLHEDELLELSELATRQVLTGEMGEKEMMLVHSALAAHSKLLGLREIGLLRIKLEELATEAQEGQNRRLSLNEFQPTWGRARAEAVDATVVDDKPVNNDEWILG